MTNVFIIIACIAIAVSVGMGIALGKTNKQLAEATKALTAEKSAHQETQIALKQKESACENIGRQKSRVEAELEGTKNNLKTARDSYDYVRQQLSDEERSHKDTQSKLEQTQLSIEELKAKHSEEMGKLTETMEAKQREEAEAHAKVVEELVKKLADTECMLAKPNAGSSPQEFLKSLVERHYQDVNGQMAVIAKQIDKMKEILFLDEKERKAYKSKPVSVYGNPAFYKEGRVPGSIRYFLTTEVIDLVQLEDVKMILKIKFSSEVVTSKTVSIELSKKKAQNGLYEMLHLCEYSRRIDDERNSKRNRYLVDLGYNNLANINNRYFYQFTTSTYAIMYMKLSSMKEEEANRNTEYIAPPLMLEDVEDITLEFAFDEE